LAWVLSVFVELAIFSDTISGKINTDYLAANVPIFQKIANYEAQLDTEIRDHYTALRALEDQYQSDLREQVTLDPAAQSQLNDYDEQTRLLDDQDRELRQRIRSARDNVRKYEEDMNAEELGQKLREHNSGINGKGARYEFAKKQKELYQREQEALEAQIGELGKKRQAISQSQTNLTDETALRRNEDRAVLKNKGQQLERQIAQQTAELKSLQSARAGKSERFRTNAIAAPDFQKLKDDPLSRMTAYQQLKDDSKNGGTIILFSWMTRLLIIFLEIVPVLAKTFFSPPSVYAAKVQAHVEKARLDAEKEVLEREQQVVGQEIELQKQKEAYAEARRERENADLRHGMVQEETLNKAHDTVITEFPSRGAAAE